MSALQEIKRLMLKADKRTPAESALSGALATFVHEYELKRHPLENHTPAEMLEFMLSRPLSRTLACVRVAF
jgi:hypothetical protein